MSGSHERLSSCAASFADDNWKDEAREVAEFLLRNQFVTITDENGIQRIYHIIKGAGQGLTFSGDVANAAYAETVEVHCPGRSWVASRFGIRLWRRVFDDVFVLLNRGGPELFVTC